MRLQEPPVLMGQGASTVQEALEEDLRRVSSVQQELCSVVTSTSHEGHTQYTIRTTDRGGNSWEAVTRYSAVVVLLKELKQKRDIMDLPMMRWAGPTDRSYRTMGYPDQWYTDRRREALDAVLAALVPRCAGLPEVRDFLRLDEGLQIHHARKQREAEKAEREAEEASKQNGREKKTCVVPKRLR